MFFYQGFQCPVCEKPFLETDDIVTCPDCGAPHHRACWRKNMQCFYAASHGTDEQWSRETVKPNTSQNGSREEVHICAHCGAPNSVFAEVCSRCGNTLQANDWNSRVSNTNSENTAENHQEVYREYRPFHTVPPHQNPFANEEIEGISTRDLGAFVGQNAGYYVNNFKKMSKKETMISWNWAAFLLTPYWLWYRKQYLYGTLVLLFEILQSFFVAFFQYGYLGLPAVSSYADIIAAMQQHISDPAFLRWEIIILLFSFVQLLISVFFGITGNYLYYGLARKRILKSNASNDKAYLFKRWGGISFALAAAAYGILYFSTMLANVFFL